MTSCAKLTQLKIVFEVLAVILEIYYDLVTQRLYTLNTGWKQVDGQRNLHRVGVAQKLGDQSAPNAWR